MGEDGGFSHLDAKGRARMVDVGDKDETRRRAVARAKVTMSPETVAALSEGVVPKGDVLAVARVAGIMAAKRTAELVPLCHPLSLTRVEVTFELDEKNATVHCQATAQTRERTGVEMEALMAVQVGLLTIYDMCKAVDRAMTIHAVRLLEKSGGKSGHWKRENEQPD